MLSYPPILAFGHLCKSLGIIQLKLISKVEGDVTPTQGVPSPCFPDDSSLGLPT